MFKWLAERKKKREFLAEQYRIAEEFLSMSEGAKRLLSIRDQLSSTKYCGGTTFHFWSTRYKNLNPYTKERIYEFAKSDYEKVKDSGQNPSMDSFKEMLFDENRFLKIAHDNYFDISEVSASEWDLITKRYVRHIAEFKRHDLAFKQNFLSAQQTTDRTFQQLAYVDEALNQIAAGEFSGTDDSQTKWLESFKGISDSVDNGSNGSSSESSTNNNRESLLTSDKNT